MPKTDAASLPSIDVEVLIAKGKKLQATNDLEGAVEAFADASAALAEAHGPDAAECADALFLYGSALYANAVSKLSPLGGAAAETAASAAQDDAVAAAEEAKQSGRFVFGGDDDGGNISSAADAAVSSSSTESQELNNNAVMVSANGHHGGHEDEEDEEGDEEDEEGDEDPVQEDMQLAWETLDLARVCYEKIGTDGELKMADVLLALGDVSLEQGQWNPAVEDFFKAVAIKTARLAPDDRELAEANYKLALAYEFAKNFDKAVECSHKVISVLEMKLKSLKDISTINDSYNTEKNERVRNEILDIEGLLPDIHSKIDDLHFQIGEAKKVALQADESIEEQTNTSSSSSSVQLAVNDISGLVKSKKNNTSKTVSPSKSTNLVTATTVTATGNKRKPEEAQHYDEGSNSFKDVAKKSKDV
ncbi:hypothetical protein HK100_001725 [Physocladia obscura]|uniref:Tetratricopeptide SHNi-TPR domain-containing protein n=1 Tax=Physocladia obscura TaxID=109957 RepID=A0AAD5T2E4_9FUNG|nr:hypothetical protein HK100_001725 [Physocladia obscura]